MAVNIDYDYDYPEGGEWRRELRGLLRFFGVILVLVGCVASAYLFFVLLANVNNFIAGKRSIFTSVSYAQTGALFIGGSAFLCLKLGYRFVQDKREVVLFLRRFEFDGATQVLTFALTQTIGTNWRLVTLDDAKTAPLGSEGACDGYVSEPAR
jgi:hypothetical protein